MIEKSSENGSQAGDIKGKPHNFVKSGVVIGLIEFSNPFRKSKRPHFAPYLILFEILFDLEIPDISMAFK